MQLAKVKAELPELMNNPQSFLLEALHTVGYQGGLAKPLVVSESSLSLITADSLAQFVQVRVHTLVTNCNIAHNFFRSSVYMRAIYNKIIFCEG